ncbi:E3 ubiquitin-protein ligase RNF183 [Hyla sarda]|uniref:E3 ubiquitin-protein ligase RNF183 n=1 Tax=Hyla sarda TaxID=327740 RepID=UPI0024C3BD46|nr:E3 ubiquitin-protein ligase RNF183 [Hyla sarda]XP_056394675.1 E3 ubiquitin-protein ligase RNF183 [Hyla sarda]XP_056394676.1 E3 ubiquitin-protein ligase RNF183 [Hyla sarda]XP_056394677.1 E3 ubiquitin-protein ligase RNF183 [Hyla sarda]XP_056394678.1 E3 ubiquitin-protein ligase RNF183 [Hyla sarda]XP_056394679.1 E3 ubiquitin-protein ligase RNF183 [Hyla sarda]
MEDSSKPDLECECPVCWNPYNNTSRTPKLLSCQHTFCMECLAHLSFTTQVRNRLHCPLCRHITMLRLDQVITDLPTNMAVLSQLKLEPDKNGLCARDSRRLNFFHHHRPPSVYTLNVGQDTGSLYGPQQSQVQSPPTTIPSDDSSWQCLRNPQFRMFSYMMMSMLVVSMLLIFSIFWTRKLLWGPG